MTVLPSAPRLPTVAEELEAIRASRGWFFVIGALMVIAGTFAISWACLTEVTIAATWIFGWLLLGSGIAEVVSSFGAHVRSGRLIHLLIGVLYVLVGLFVIDQPVDSAILLTRFIAIFLIVGGVFRVIFAIGERFHGWGAVCLNGVVSFLLGLMIYRQWPASGLWVIGLFFGIELILNGWTWIMLAIALKAPKANA